jgi:hypothetical protein
MYGSTTFKGRSGRGCRIEGVAAVGQHARPGRRGERMRRGHHAVPRCDGWPLAVLKHVLSPGCVLAGK